MDSKQLDKYGMLLKVDDFFETNSSIFSPLPQYPPLIDEMNDLLEKIIKESSISTANNEGQTEAKQKTRDSLQLINCKVGSALLSYGMVNSAPYIIEREDYLPGSLRQSTDSELYVLAVQLYKLALPVQGSLTPYGSGSVDVAKLNSVSEEFLPQIKIARNQVKAKSRAVKRLKDLFAAADETLEKFDSHMAVYQFTNNPLWKKYMLARKIDKRGGGHTLHKKIGKVLPGHLAHALFAAEVLKAKSKLILSNTKNKVGELIFYFSAKPNEKPTAKTKLTTVIFSKPVKITAADAGYTVQAPHLQVLNPNVRIGGWKAEVEIK